MPSVRRRVARPEPKVAIVPWGDVVDDFLEPSGLSIKDLATEVSGGWLFGYVEALRQAGVSSCTVWVSRRVKRSECLVHQPSGTPLWVLPPPGAYRATRYLRDRYPWTEWRLRGPLRAAARLTGGALSIGALYLSTPPTLMARVLRRESCTAVLCQEYENPRFDVCVALGHFLGLPVFGTFQGGQKSTRLDPLVRPSSVRASAGLIAAPAAEAERARRRYRMDGSRVAQIPNPLDEAAFSGPERPAARRALGLPEDAAVAAWHGRVEIKPKGLDILVDAWAQVCAARRERSLHLLMIGTGSDADAIHRRISDARLSNVWWLDRYVTDRSVIRTHLRAADVYAFPSRREGFPVAPLEAMACGLPIVAADSLGVAELVGEHGQHGGIRVPVGDLKAFASSLGEALDNLPGSHAAGRRARRRAAEVFSVGPVGSALRTFLTADSRRWPG